MILPRCCARKSVLHREPARQAHRLAAATKLSPALTALCIDCVASVSNCSCLGAGQMALLADRRDDDHLGGARLHQLHRFDAISPDRGSDRPSSPSSSPMLGYRYRRQTPRAAAHRKAFPVRNAARAARKSLRYARRRFPARQLAKLMVATTQPRSNRASASTTAAHSAPLINGPAEMMQEIISPGVSLMHVDGDPRFAVDRMDQGVPRFCVIASSNSWRNLRCYPRRGALASASPPSTLTTRATYESSTAGIKSHTLEVRTLRWMTFSL